MRSKIGMCFFLASILAILGLLTMPVLAEETDRYGNYPAQPAPENIPPKMPRSFGTTSATTVSVNSGSCTPIRSTYTYDQNFSWRWGTTGGGVFFDCSIPLPSGAQVTYVEAEVDDSTATDEVSIAFSVCPGTSSECTYYPDTFVNSGVAATPGKSYLGMDLTSSNITVDNFNNTYLVRVAVRSGDSSTQFRTVLVDFVRQISPAPGVATFNDVPTNHWAFQFIEALADSGITTGCAPGFYCPNGNVTRAEMAAFLARALGLHWPN